MKKLLIIENDADTIDVLKIVFQDDYDIITSTKRISQKAIEAIDPDVAIIDYLLDDCLGTEICVELKETPTTSHIPLILFSASHAIGKMEHRNCADAFIPKPFDLDVIIETINKLVK